jgi:hypothetical protein
MPSEARDPHAETNIQYTDFNTTTADSVINVEVKQHSRICQKENNCEIWIPKYSQNVNIF